jgi:drug/metabolite transporter (DMT)-like permease
MALVDIIVLGLMRYQLAHYNPYYFLIAFIFYGCQPLIFYYSLKNGGDLARNNILWNLLSILTLLIFSVVMFNEKFNTKQYFGILLSTIAIYLLS